MSLCQQCFDRWTNDEIGSNRFVNREKLHWLISSVTWMTALDECLVYEGPAGNGESTEHFRKEGTWNTYCGQSIAEMRVDSGIGEIDGVAFALLEASRSDLFTATHDLMEQKAPMRRIDWAFRHYSVNRDLIREMSANKRFHQGIAVAMQHVPPNQVFKFEPLRILYVRRFRRKSKRLVKVNVEKAKTPLIPCPHCKGPSDPTGHYQKVPYSMEVEAKLSISPLRARKEWRYETQFKCRKCRFLFSVPLELQKRP